MEVNLPGHEEDERDHQAARDQQAALSPASSFGFSFGLGRPACLLPPAARSLLTQIPAPASGALFGKRLPVLVLKSPTKALAASRLTLSQD